MTRNNSAKPIKATIAAAPFSAAATTAITSVAASDAIYAVAIDDGAPDAKGSTPDEAAIADPAKPAVGTKRKKQLAAAIVDAGPSKAAKVVRKSEVQKTARLQRYHRGQRARRDVKEVKKVLKAQTKETVVGGKAAVEVEHMNEDTGVPHAQRASHSNERSNVKEANVPVVRKVEKAPKAVSKVGSLITSSGAVRQRCKRKSEKAYHQTAVTSKACV